MAQSLTLGVNLGAGLAGQSANLRAQLRGTNGATVGGLVSSGFTETGTKGTYQWFYASYPDGFEGTVEFSISGTVWSIVGINNADFGITTAPSAATIATAVWANATRTLTSFGTLVADMATAVWAYGTRTLTSAIDLDSTDLAQIAAAVWTYVARTLTSSAAQTAADIAGGDLAILRGDTWDETLTGLGNITGRTKLWFTVKVSEQDADSAAILQLEESAGLVYFNGAVATAGNGSITVTNATAGDVTIHLIAARTAELVPKDNLYYDLQWRTASGEVHTLISGRIFLNPDITRAVS